jgi:hypothetical protein
VRVRVPLPVPFKIMKIRFDGDIIITDPCYIDYKEQGIRKLWDLNSVHLATGQGLKKHGFTNYLWSNTLYGDWSCHTFLLHDSAINTFSQDITEKDTNGTIGRFCADAGLVAVFLLDEVLKFNPNFDYHLNKPWTTTLIKNFIGDIEIHTINVKDELEKVIRGTGNVNFITRQTGL